MIDTTKVWFMKIMFFKKAYMIKSQKIFYQLHLWNTKFTKRENQGSAIQESGCDNFGSFLQH